MDASVHGDPLGVLMPRNSMCAHGMRYGGMQMYEMACPRWKCPPKPTRTCTTVSGLGQ